ncbi:hypothetical protein [Paraburkholderia sp. GAS334]|uniref:hypothetical protein n=1 Tax=Paraburkholderia sp. GAS334 TaxID=3035131 RepID=UPI003D1C6581
MNVFTIEKFIDERALAAQVDPVQYRINHLDDARTIEVIKLAAILKKGAELAAFLGLGNAALGEIDGHPDKLCADQRAEFASLYAADSRSA